jgi:hypothetical protein
MQFDIGDDFIGIFDDVFDESVLNNLINYYRECENTGIVKSRNQYHTPNKHVVDDNSVDLFTAKFFYPEINTKYISSALLEEFWGKCYLPYADKYTILRDYGKHKIYDSKLQLIPTGGGYHVWHSEVMTKENRDRILAFMIYLNDVDEGGETEFLYLKKRIKPKRNRVLIWPAGFTHTHRGNPPLSNDKFIVTGWIELGV